MVDKIIGVLVAAFIAERFYSVHKKRENFDKEYSKFSEPLINFIEGIQDKKVSLNYALLTEFKNHKRLKDVFIRNLKGKNLSNFNRKWSEYEAHYKEVSDRGILGVAAAIPPDLEALENAAYDRSAPREWEADRKHKIHNIVSELLEVAKIKIWF